MDYSSESLDEAMDTTQGTPWAIMAGPFDPNGFASEASMEAAPRRRTPPPYIIVVVQSPATW
jgi:hypothetical protein